MPIDPERKRFGIGNPAHSLGSQGRSLRAGTQRIRHVLNTKPELNLLSKRLIGSQELICINFNFQFIYYTGYIINLKQEQHMKIEAFYDPQTYTVTYIVFDPEKIGR